MEIFKTINPTLYIVLLSVALLSAIGFVIFSKGQRGLLSLALKSVASFCFTLLAVATCLIKGMSVAGLLFVMGFVAAIIGDVILALPGMPEMKDKSMILTLIGGLSFTVTHVCYTASIILLCGFKWWIILIAVALGLIFFFGNKLFGSLNYGPLTAGMPVYSTFVSFDLAVSIMALISGVNLVGAVLLVAGLFLFWLSDIVLMHIYFGNKPEKHEFLYYFNLTFYYLGQILIAASMIFLI